VVGDKLIKDELERDGQVIASPRHFVSKIIWISQEQMFTKDLDGGEAVWHARRVR
jgi:hypothetical protein